MLIDFYNIWHTQYSQVICDITIIDMSTSPAYCCYITSENINFWFLRYFGWFVPSTKLFRWLWNVTMKSDQWKIFTVAKMHATMMLSWMLVQEMLRPLVPLLRRWHIFQQGSEPAHWCVHQTIELLQYEAPKFTGPGLWPPIRPVWVKEKVIAISELCWTIIAWKNLIFFRMCNRNI